MFNNENVKKHLDVNPSKQPSSIEDAKINIENLEKELTNFKEMSKRMLILLESIALILILTETDKHIESKERNFFNQEFQKLKNNIEYANLHFKQSEIEDENIRKFTDKTTLKIIESIKIYEEQTQNALKFLTKAQEIADSLKISLR